MNIFKTNNTPIIKAYIEHGCDLNVMNKKEKTPLYYAVKNNNYEIVKEMLDNGANGNISRKTSANILIKAVRVKNVKLVELLLDYGVKDFGDYSESDFFGDSALILAIIYKLQEIIELLLFHKSNPCDLNFIGWNDSALSCTIVKKDFNLVKLLIDCGADLNLQNLNKSLLLKAVEYEELPILKLLLERGAQDLHKRGHDTALIYACENGYLEMIQLLLSFDHIQTGINHFGNNNNTPLITAINLQEQECEIEKKIKILKLLLEAGADPCLYIDMYPPIILAVNFKNSEMQTLLDYGADPKYSIWSPGGPWNVMAAALSANNYPAVVSLLIAGAKVYRQVLDSAKFINIITPMLPDTDHKTMREEWLMTIPRLVNGSLNKAWERYYLEYPGSQTKGAQ